MKTFFMFEKGAGMIKNARHILKTAHLKGLSLKGGGGQNAEGSTATVSESP